MDSTQPATEGQVGVLCELSSVPRFWQSARNALTPDAMLFLLGASAINVSLIGLCYLRGRGRYGVEAVTDRVHDWQDEHARRTAAP